MRVAEPPVGTPNFLSPDASAALETLPNGVVLGLEASRCDIFPYEVLQAHVADKALRLGVLRTNTLRVRT
jgi:hypothetical protein